MVFFGILIALFLFFTSGILPWLNHDKIKQLNHEIAELRGTIAWLKNRLSVDGEVNSSATSPENTTHKTEAQPAKMQPVVTPVSPINTGIEDDPFEWVKPRAVQKPLVRASSISDRQESKSSSNNNADSSGSFEQQFGGRAFVWMGAIALIFAGFYMVKYSIESGMLTPQIRVIMGILFGFVMLAGGYFIRRHPRFADGVRISQALTGAGIADLYGSLFAATSLYHLLPSWVGFTGMAAVTSAALVLSLRYGAPIALLGLIGGFATPMMIHGSDPNAPLLFGYLYLVFGGLAVVIRRQGWWWMAIPATLFAFLWAGLWMAWGYAPVDGTWLSIFLMGICATAVVATHNVDNSDDQLSLPNCFRYCAIGGSLLLLGGLTDQAHFGIFEWGMFGLFSVAAIALAKLGDRSYAFAPWTAVAINVVLLLNWEPTDIGFYAEIILSFGLLFSVIPYVMMIGARSAVSWAGMSAGSALVYYLIGYHRFHGTIADQDAKTTIFTKMSQSLLAHDAGQSAHSIAVPWLYNSYFWTALAYSLAIISAVTTYRFFSTRPFPRQRYDLQAIFAVATTSFLSIGSAVLLNQEYWMLVIAVQIATLGLLSRRADIPALRSIAIGLTALFGLLFLPDAMRVLGAVFESLPVSMDSKWHVATQLLWQLGIPAGLFAIASWLFRQSNDDDFVKILEVAALILFSVMGYKLTGTIFVGQGNEFVARGIFTNMLLLISMGSLWCGRVYARPALQACGPALAVLAVARIVAFDLLFNNPLWSHQMVGEWPLLNILALVYGLPALIISYLNVELTAARHVDMASKGKAVAYILTFIFVSLNVRQFYHGAYLDVGTVSNAEVYTYSVIWLLLGVVMLLAGTVRQDRLLRVGSLFILLLTVAKVFLYDASELTGLWRVVSFLGLGMSLLGLSWFYSRFVFNTRK